MSSPFSVRANRRVVPPAAARARWVMWAYAALAIGGLIVAIQAQRHKIDGILGALALLILVVSLLGLFITARSAARESREDREREGRTAMLMMIAGQLGQQDDTTLERVAGQKGMAGEAARLILENRAAKRLKADPPA